MSTDKHDDHYRKIEQSGIEPIVIMEELLHRMIETGIPVKAAGMIMLAQKHITRAGLKQGDDWKKDIAKARNYLHRAMTGEWEPTVTAPVLDEPKQELKIPPKICKHCVKRGTKHCRLPKDARRDDFGCDEWVRNLSGTVQGSTSCLRL